MRWTAEQVPDQTGRVAIITGANSGIGFEAASVLAGKGARVVLACRSTEKADSALASLLRQHPGASVENLSLDLASLESVRAFAGQFLDRHSRLDLLINNAGVMAIPRRTTVDGFEMQFGTNHLGHFALTGLLLERLVASAPGRVVTVSSNAHTWGKMTFDDLQRERDYDRWRVYGQSKLSNLLFSYELGRRLERRGIDVRSVACHPGYAATNLQYVGPRMDSSKLMGALMTIGNSLIAQSSAMGALPTLFAATAPAAQNGDFIGPDGYRAARGYPTRLRSNRASRSEEDAARLWDVSRELTGVSFAVLD